MRGSLQIRKMSFKLRSVNTKFWEDPFVEELSPEEKLLFLYLITNPLTNILGIYELTIKRMAYDSGLGFETIRKGLESFKKKGKVFYFENFVILPNFLKNQNLNKNMQIGACKLFDSLPESVKNLIITNDSEPFGTIRNTLLNMNRNMNIESEKEKESYHELFHRLKIEYILPEGYEELFLLWLKYKAEKKQSYTETGLKSFINKTLKEFTTLEAFSDACENSTSKNYAGLFPDNNKKKGFIEKVVGSVRVKQFK